MTHSIYLSYAHADEKWAHELLTRLRADGYDASDIPITLESADVLLVVTTPTSVVSEGVKSDLDAFAAHRKTVIPIIPPSAPDGTINWMPHHLALLPYVDFSENEASAYQTLRHRLGAPSQPSTLPEDHVPRGKSRLSLGLLILLILAATLVGALASPPDSPIPRPLGYAMFGAVLLGLLLLVWRIIAHARAEAARLKALQIPPAFVEIIESSLPREVGRRWRIKHLRTHLGRSSSDHIRLPRRGVKAKQCSIVYDPHDGIFYLETTHPTALTTLHDRVLEPDRPLPMWNGDLIMLTEQIVLQFRLPSNGS